MKKQILLLLAILMTVGITAIFAGNLDNPTQHPIIDPNAISTSRTPHRPTTMRTPRSNHH